MMAWLSRLIMVVLLWSVPLGAMGQTSGPEQPLLKTEELDQLLAPIALYGVMMIVINHRAIIYQKDLDPRMTAIAAGMTAFNPDITRKGVTDFGAPSTGAPSP
jgi:Protein of unknown function (DUF2950)